MDCLFHQSKLKKRKKKVAISNLMSVLTADLYTWFYAVRINDSQTDRQTDSQDKTDRLAGERIYSSYTLKPRREATIIHCEHFSNRQMHGCRHTDRPIRGEICIIIYNTLSAVHKQPCTLHSQAWNIQNDCTRKKKKKKKAALYKDRCIDSEKKRKND